MNYKYNVVDGAGRLWVRTMTRIKAARAVQELFETKGLVCLIMEVK